jgi:hypothetical protein
MGLMNGLKSLGDVAVEVEIEAGKVVRKSAVHEADLQVKGASRKSNLL